MSTSQLLRNLMKAAHEVLEGTVADVNTQTAQWCPPGKAHPVGALYVHILMGEDSLLNGAVRGGAPLFATTFAGKVGVSETPPAPDQDGWDEWARRVQVDMAVARAYAAAVYAETDAYLASQSDADLGKTIKHPFANFGFPDTTPADFIASVLSQHVAHHTGEISAMKGVQGLKGYPF